MAMLDSTVVNVALPSIGKDLGATVAGLQWVLTGYLLPLSALLLIGGSLGDRFGRRRIFVVGVVWFAASSLLCAVAPTLNVLIAARLLQGAGGALLVPGSLALIEATFAPDDRGRAIGAWTGLGGVASAIGPLVGGWLVAAVSWRLIFVINLPVALVVLVAARHVPDSRRSGAGHIDVAGAILVVLGLAGATYALIEGPGGQSATGLWVGAGIIGAVALVAFFVVEARRKDPMLPLRFFRSRQFSAANIVTFLVYGALGGVLFLLTVDLQQVLGYSALAAGASLLPVTLIMLGLSLRAGQLSQRIGPRLPMSLGPLVMALGLVLKVRITPTSAYVADVLPAVVVFALGLALTVAPLTTTALGALDDQFAGTASGVNNAVARLASLLAVAVLPALSGLTGTAYRVPEEFSSGFHTSVLIGAGMCAAGALVALVGITNPALAASGPPPAGLVPHSCPLDAPVLRGAHPGHR